MRNLTTASARARSHPNARDIQSGDPMRGGAERELTVHKLDFEAGERPAAGACLLLRVTASDAATGKAVSDLEPYLEAQAHFVMAREGLLGGEPRYYTARAAEADMFPGRQVASVCPSAVSMIRVCPRPCRAHDALDGPDCTFQ